MTVNITVVTHNRLALTRICLESLLEKTSGDYCVTIVDNASSDGTRDYLETLVAHHAHVEAHFLSSNMGVAVAANFGWARQPADYYVKLDNDIEIRDPRWLELLVGVAARNPSLGMVSYLLAEWGCRKDLIRLADGQAFITTDVCNGGCVLIPAHVHAVLGFWVEDHGKYGYEDKNYSDRAILAGYQVGYIPVDPLPVRHMGHESGFTDLERENAKKKDIDSLLSGENLYVFNKFMFDSGIRPLYVERRYLPHDHNGKQRFTLNPAYLPIVRIHNDYLQKIRYEGHAEGIHLDLSRLK